MTYRNIFNLTDNMAQSITNIINANEDKQYVCAVLNASIPEHKETVFSSPYNDNFGGPSWSGAELEIFNKKYGRYIEEIIPEEEISFIAVMEQQKYEQFLNSKFKNEQSIKRSVLQMSELATGYAGMFDCNIFYSRFPYLLPFFKHLDEFRTKTGRVTVDDEVLIDAEKIALSSTECGDETER